MAETKTSEDFQPAAGDRYQCDNEKLFQRTDQGVLQRRPQTMEAIESAALLLVADQPSAITGQTLNVDGGTTFY